MPPPPTKHDDLPRVLTATNALAIVVGIIIGSGIFLVPREMMAAVGSARLVYAVWITAACSPSSAPCPTPKSPP